MDFIGLSQAKNYTNQIALGISDAVVSGTTVTFTIAATGEKASVTLPTPKDGKDGKDGQNGVSISDVQVNSNNQVIITFSDGSTATAGVIKTVKGDKGDKGDRGERGEKGDTPSLDGVATTEYVDNVIKNVEVDLTGYVKTEDLEELKKEIQDSEGSGNNNNNNSSTGTITVPDAIDSDANYDIYVNSGKLKLYKHDYTLPKSFTDNTASEVMLAMEPGINIGNALDSYDTKRGFGEDSFLNQELCWGNPEITQGLIERIKSLGFRSVRIPVTWYHNTYIDTDGKRKVGKYFKARVREVVDWALDAGLYVVINAHFDAAKGFLFKIGESEEDFQTILKDVEDVWGDIADKFKMYGDKLVFESFNEISTSNAAYGNIVTTDKNDQFTLLNQKFVDTVRATGFNNANRILIIQSMYTKQWHHAANIFVVPTDTVENKLAYAMHPYTQLIGEQNADFFRKLVDCKSIIGLPMSFNEWGTFKKEIPTDTWRYKQAQDFTARCFGGGGINTQWWDNGKESEFKLLDRIGTEDKEDIISGLFGGRSTKKPNWFIRPSKVHTLTGANVQKGTWAEDGTLVYKSTWGSISSPMYDIGDNKYAQYSCITMNEADEKIVVMGHIKYYDADGNLFATTGSSATLKFPTLERLDEIPEGAVKCCYSIYSKHNHLTFEQYRDLINNKDLVCRVALFNGESDMEQVTGNVTNMNLKYTYWEEGNKFDEVNGAICLVEDTSATALQMPRKCKGNTKYNIEIADYINTANDLSVELIESNCDDIVLVRHILSSGATSFITNSETSKMYINIIGDGNFSESITDVYEKVSPITSFKDRTCTAFTINSNEITLTAIGQQFEILVQTITPEDSVDVPLYAVSDDTVVKVENGIITALKKGTATIFVYLGESYQKIEVTVDTSSSVIPIEFSNNYNYITKEGVWDTSSGEYGVRGIRVEPNSVYSITRSGSYAAWRAAESDKLGTDANILNIVELDSKKTEETFTTSSTATYLLISGAISKMKTLEIEKTGSVDVGTNNSNSGETGNGDDNTNNEGTSGDTNNGSTNVDNLGSVPQSGTWQLKTTEPVKYVILGTDDDNQGNAKYFRMLRTYEFPYTMNVEAEKINADLGTDEDTNIFTDSDAPSLFSDGVTVAELGKYLHDNDLGEVAQHGSSANTLWDSQNLTGDAWESLYASYIAEGGTKTEDELKNAITETMAYTDGSQDAQYVADSRDIIEEELGFPILTVGAWGGSPSCVIDDITLDLNSFKGTSNYDWRSHNYFSVSSYVANFHINDGLYDISRMNDNPSEIAKYIDMLPYGKVIEFFYHMPFNDEPDISKWRTLFDNMKQLQNEGKIQVVTRYQYAMLGEYVDNPITSLTISRSGNLNIGEIDSSDAYTVSVTYADGTIGSPSDDMILDISNVDTNTAGTYAVHAYYRGFVATCNVVVINASYSVPSGLKDTDYWFVYSNDTNGNWYCGNYSKQIVEAKKSSSTSTLVFSVAEASGKLNGWKSVDNGTTWEQVTTNKTTYNTNITTNKTSDTDGGYQFGSQYNDSITWIETSGNFELNY